VHGMWKRKKRIWLLNSRFFLFLPLQNSALKFSFKCSPKSKCLYKNLCSWIQLWMFTGHSGRALCSNPYALLYLFHCFVVYRFNRCWNSIQIIFDLEAIGWQMCKFWFCDTLLACLTRVNQ
jgi:hypothetical protein